MMVGEHISFGQIDGFADAITSIANVGLETFKLLEQRKANKRLADLEERRQANEQTALQMEQARLQMMQQMGLQQRAAQATTGTGISTQTLLLIGGGVLVAGVAAILLLR